MNILVPHQWLLDHLDTNATPKDIQRCLSLCGPSVERIYEREGDSVYDIEVTTNRVDAASVRGIAREAAAILPEFGFAANLKPLPSVDIPTKLPDLDIEIINNPKLCHRIVAVKLANVKLDPSPPWLQQRLRQIDLRPLNNAIDITNYIMWDIGHPIHAFDYDRLTNKKIVVREAKKGETFTTLDNKTHTCRGGEVVFDDGTGVIIDLPGIMGTANSVVTDTTNNVLLWIESVDAVKIRQASMGLSIRTQAAVLNEKQVDPELALTALHQAISMYQHITKAGVATTIFDQYPHPTTVAPTTITQADIDAYLGISIKPQKITSILTSLGCQVKHQQHTYSITPPSYRARDLAIKEDYIEEIARIYGYHNLPSVIMPTAIPTTTPPENFSLEYYIKLLLTGWGAQEVYTYSMVSQQLALESGFSLTEHLKITNPLSDDWVYLRRSLIPSLHQVIDANPDSPSLIFEMQNVYHPQPHQLPDEELHLTLITNQEYAVLKGILDALAKKLFVNHYVVTPSGIIQVDGQNVGTITAQRHRFIADITMKKLLPLVHTHPTTVSLHQYPPIIEDLTFTFPPQTYVGPIIDMIKAVSPIIANVIQKDVYQHNHTFTISYQSDQQNLSTEDIAPIRKKIVDTLQQQHINLVGHI